MIRRAIRFGARSILGAKSASRLVVFESDDWGAVRTPSPSAGTRLQRFFNEDWNSPMFTKDSLESSDDLEALFQILRSVHDSKGRCARITANVVVGNPDFEVIERSGFEEFQYETFINSLRRERGQECVSSWMRGVREGLMIPQLHGREHLHAFAWMRLLAAGDASARVAFDERSFSFPVSVPQAFPKRNLSAALNRFGIAGEQEFQRTYLVDAMRIFREIFGYRSETFIAPSYIWESRHESALMEHKIRVIQGIGFQYMPVSSSDARKVFRYTGQRNESGQTYTVRNAFFEPALDQSVDWLNRCLKQIDLAFRFRCPAIVGTHRVNFIGGLDIGNRETNLGLFRQLLAEIVRRWPDVEFVDSSELSRRLGFLGRGTEFHPAERA